MKMFDFQAKLQKAIRCRFLAIKLTKNEITEKPADDYHRAGNRQVFENGNERISFFMNGNEITDQGNKDETENQAGERRKLERQKSHKKNKN